VLEHVAFPVFFNLVEHLGYMANAVLLLSWCWMAMRSTTVDVND
jgi:hypothetical protein